MMKQYYIVLFLVFALSTKAQIINIPDVAFKNKLLAASPGLQTAKNAAGVNIKVDVNSDGEIQLSEAAMVAQLRVQSSNIASLEGIKSFPNLTTLYCATNNLASIDLAGLSMLHTLNMTGNPLVSIILENCASLTAFTYNGNQIIETIDLSGCTSLQTIDCMANWEMQVLDISGCGALTSVKCAGGKLTEFDFTSLSNVTFNNKLSTLIVKNLQNENFLEFCGNPALKHICGDNYDITDINTQLAACGIVGCLVTQDCNLLPGQDDFEIVGTTRLDSGSNGCSAADSGFSNMRFQSFSGSASAYLFANSSGNLSAFVPPGTFGIVPAFEIPGYFTATPSMANISFPGTPPAMNFCVVPSGVHHDLDVTILPLGPARPGFPSNYKIIYRNKGNQTESGTVTFSYDDARLDLAQTVPASNAQTTGMLEWNYTNLLPSESREIGLSMLVNAPTDSPPVNAGDELPFAAVVNPVEPDDTPADNSFGFKQIVVNPFDPNSITCLEGAVVGTEVIGNYVHYVIRFENLGTAQAENVTITDLIDPSRFDINSLIPLSGSHAFETRILDEENQVVFYFEGINLPFDDATNDGYVAFKIKTRPSLVVGDEFTSTALIYFDFNYPVVTNTATTTIQLLDVNEFEDSMLMVYPNPAGSIINIGGREDAEIQSIEIYNSLGQLLISSPGKSQIDVSRLPSGTYFVKISLADANAVSTFIKR